VTIKEIVRRTGYSRDLARKVLRGHCPDGGAHRSEVILGAVPVDDGREPFRIPGGPLWVRAEIGPRPLARLLYSVISEVSMAGHKGSNLDTLSKSATPTLKSFRKFPSWTQNRRP
jgi:hypothetical protein